MASLVLAATTAVVAAMATANGIGITPDGVAYLQLARELGEEGRFHISPSWSSSTHYPPGWSYLVGVISLVPGLSTAGAARAANLAASGVGVVVLAWAVRGRTIGGRWVAVAAAAYLATLPLWIELASHALTEPLYCVAVVGCLLALERAVIEGSRRPLQVAIALAAVATLVRYLGAALIVPVAVVAFLRRGGPLRNRFASSALAAIAVVVPIGVWLASSPASWVPDHSSSGATADAGRLLESLEILGGVLPQASLLPDSRWLAIAAGVTVLLLPAVLWTAGRGAVHGQMWSHFGAGPPMLPWLLFGYTYVVIVGVQRWRGDREVLDRYWLPFVVVVLIVVLRSVSAADSRMARGLVVVGLIAAAIVNLQDATSYVRAEPRRRSGYQQRRLPEVGVVRGARRTRRGRRLDRLARGCCALCVGAADERDRRGSGARQAVRPGRHQTCHNRL